MEMFAGDRANAYRNVADDNASDSTCMSLKRATYWHEDGYIVSGGKGVEKWVTSARNEPLLESLIADEFVYKDYKYCNLGKIE